MTDILQRASLEPLLPGDPRQKGSPVTLYLLGRDFTVETDVLGRFTVPAGFLTDLASIPRSAWQFLDPEDPRILYPSIAHDWAYTAAGTLPDGRTFTRADADKMLVELMAFCDAGLVIRGIVHEAVHFGGGSHWGNKT